MSDNTLIHSSRVLGWLKLCDHVISQGFLFRGSRVFALVAGVLILALMVIICMGVLSRQLANISGTFFNGSVELTELLISEIGILAIAYTWYAKGHLRVRLLLNRFGTRTTAIVNALSALMGALFSGLACWGIWTNIAIPNLNSNSDSDVLGLPFAGFQIPFCIVLGFLALVFLRSSAGFVAQACGRMQVEHDSSF